MSSIHVCALSKIDETVRDSGAQSLVSLLHLRSEVERPAAIAAAHHLFVGMADIVEAQAGLELPEHRHVEQLLGFVRAWDRIAPLVIHCFAGVSRSTAAAYIAACALQPERTEAEIAAHIRDLSPTATPNPRLVALADQILAREGRMVTAIAAIGRGADCFEGVPFSLALPRAP